MKYFFGCATPRAWLGLLAAGLDALSTAAKQRKRPRDIALFLIIRYTGMRRESVASLRVRHLDGDWGLRGVHVKGGKPATSRSRR